MLVFQKTKPLGQIVHLTGTLSPVTFEDYSPELSLLRFAKIDGRWVVSSLYVQIV